MVAMDGLMATAMDGTMADDDDDNGQCNGAGNG
jgi:hypothetical protein